MRAAVSPDCASTTSKVLEPAWLMNTRSCGGAGGPGVGAPDEHDGNPAHESARQAIVRARLGVVTLTFTKRR